MDGDSPIFDPEALEAAERAARESVADDGFSARVDSDQARVDEEWVTVASAARGDQGRSLEPLYEVLRDAGIPAGFDPYRPGVASSPYGQGARLVKLVVPESYRSRALDVIRESQRALAEESPDGGRGVVSSEEMPLERWQDSRPWFQWVVAILVVLLLVGMLYSAFVLVFASR